jgi:hypothetical protein
VLLAEELTLDGISLLVSRETPKDPPQYYVRKYPTSFRTALAATEQRITNFPHPYEELRDLQKVHNHNLTFAGLCVKRLELKSLGRKQRSSGICKK